MLNILITEPVGYSPAALKILRSVGRLILLKNKKDLEKQISRANILVIKLNFHIDADLINEGKKIKLIATTTTGLNHIDVNYAESRGIKILSLRGQADFLQNVHSTAEHTIGLLLALVRKLPHAFDSVKKGQWQRERFYGRELFGKTLGILGYGRLGKMVARYAQCLGLKILTHDPYVSSPFAVGLTELLRRSNIISVHVLLTPVTQNLLKEKHLKMMKVGSLLINTARGEIIKDGALVRALKEGWIAGAAVDVLWNERPDGSHLRHDDLVDYARKYDNLIITPHLGGATVEAMAQTEGFLAKKIKEYAKKL